MAAVVPTGNPVRTRLLGGRIRIEETVVRERGLRGLGVSMGRGIAGLIAEDLNTMMSMDMDRAARFPSESVVHRPRDVIETMPPG